jgi:hypothetical protein
MFFRTIDDFCNEFLFITIKIYVLLLLLLLLIKVILKDIEIKSNKSIFGNKYLST